MRPSPELIYCAGGNSRFAQIAIEEGYRYGARLPDTVYAPLYFADQKWTAPNRAAYMRALQEHQPFMATVLDWEYKGQLCEILEWAEEATQYVQRIVIVPKVVGGISLLPRRINGKQVVLGYSVSSQYGQTPVPQEEFADWPVHLLGGSPQRQLREWSDLCHIADVISVDGNMAQKMAVWRCCFWSEGKFRPLSSEYDGPWDRQGPYEAFRRSCVNIREAWKQQGSQLR
jgi:hypothetical protein